MNVRLQSTRPDQPAQRGGQDRRHGRFGLSLRGVLRLAAFLVALFAGLSDAADPVGRAFAQAVPIPSVTLGLPPSDPLIGEPFTITLTFDNTSPTTTGYGPYIDLFLPYSGVDGGFTSPNDGISFGPNVGTPGVTVYPTTPNATYQGQAVVKVTTVPCNRYHSAETFGQFPGAFAAHPLTNQYVDCPPPVAGGSTLPGPIPGWPSGTDPGYYTQLVVLELPFGSFVPNQPAAEIKVNVNLDKFADEGKPLLIGAGAGFRYGATPTGGFFPIYTGYGPPFGGGGWQGPGDQKTVTPRMFTVIKSFTGPENETATGPNFGPNPPYPFEYVIDVNIPAGQTLSNLVVDDVLPSNNTYVSFTSTSNSGVGGTFVSGPTPVGSQGGTLRVSFPSPIVGSSSLSDAQVRVKFFVNQFVAPGSVSDPPVIDPNTGGTAASKNTATASGQWVPEDPRDLPSTVLASAEHTIQDKSLAIQKSRVVLAQTPLTGQSPAPGDRVEYTLNFQVSDYFAFNRVVVDDVIPDGQEFDSAFTPTLSINNNPSPTWDSPLAVFSAAGGNHGPLPLLTTPPGSGAGGTTPYQFRVSNEMITRGVSGNGVLVGGCVPMAVTGTGGYGPTGAAPPYCPNGAPYNNGATTGTIVFRTIIRENYYVASKGAVDQADLMTNTVTISATLLKSTNLTSVTTVLGTPITVTDTSSASVKIVTGGLTKSIYAINTTICSTATPCVVGSSGLVLVTPGDNVTYRIRYSLPTSDFESLQFVDYLPLPIFNLSSSPPIPPILTFVSPATNATPPAAGQAQYGPLDTFHPPPTSATINPPLAAGVNPQTPTINVLNNNITFTYPLHSDVLHPQTEIDILFTQTVSAQPFADGLHLTNLVTSRLGNTGGFVDHSSIVQVQLGEPVLKITKGVVATNYAGGTFIPAPPAPPPIVFNLPGNTATAPNGNWTVGTITSPVLPTSFNSNLGNVSGSHMVTFVIVVENTGGASAFDVKIKDLVPVGYIFPGGTAAGMNLRVTDGAGTPINFVSVPPASFFPLIPALLSPPNQGIELVDSASVGSLAAYNTTNGKNIAVITYDLMLDNTVTTGQVLTNTATLFNYAGVNSGPNHVPLGRTDSATVSVKWPVLKPDLKKIVLSTEINNANNNNAQAVIGELVTYRVSFTAAVGAMLNATLVDTLPPGLAYQSFISCTLLGPGLSSSIIGVPLPPTLFGHVVTINFGTITNTSTVPGTVRCDFRAVVLNELGNQDDVLGLPDGTPLQNRVKLTWTGGSQIAVSPLIRVIEPLVSTTKSVVTTENGNPPGLGGNPVTYTIVLTNLGSADAYDLFLDDQIPTEILTPLLDTALTTPTTPPITLVGNGLFLPATFTLPVGSSVTIVVKGTMKSPISMCQQIKNKATIRWTSLPGNPGIRSAFNTASTERTGTGGLNDYTSGQSATLTEGSCLTLEPTTGGSVANGAAPRTKIVTYTTVITNKTTTAATGVTYTSPLDPNAPLVPGSVQTSTGTITNDDSSVVVDIGAMMPGESVRITYRVTVDLATTTSNTIHNQGTVTSNEFIPAMTDDPGTEKVGDPTIIDFTMPVAAPIVHFEPTPAPRPAAAQRLEPTATLTAKLGNPDGGDGVAVDVPAGVLGSEPAIVGLEPAELPSFEDQPEGLVVSSFLLQIAPATADPSARQRTSRPVTMTVRFMPPTGYASHRNLSFYLRQSSTSARSAQDASTPAEWVKIPTTIDATSNTATTTVDLTGQYALMDSTLIPQLSYKVYIPLVGSPPSSAQ